MRSAFVTILVLRHWNNGLQFLHPDLMAGNDPFLYQAWLAALPNFLAAAIVMSYRSRHREQALYYRS
jgi:hypothetical protein